jgi:hypothetical protein
MVGSFILSRGVLPMAVMTSNKRGVRDFLRGAGYQDDEIQWDPNTKAVTARGQYFGNYTPEADGSTYDTADNLQANLRNLNANNRQAQLQPLVNSLVEKVNTPAPQPFQYNPYADPLYQNALSAARQESTVEANNTLARMRANGQGKSSWSEGVAHQIGQDAVADVNARVMPQLAQQAYGRHMDQYNMGQDQMRNLSQIVSFLVGMDQQDFENSRAISQDNRQNRLDNLGVAMQLGDRYGTTVTPTEDWSLMLEQVLGLTPLSRQEFDFQRAAQEAGFTGMWNGQPTMQKQAQDANQDIQRQQLEISRQNASSRSTSPSVTQTRYNDQQAAKELQGQVFDELSQLDPQDYEEFLETNKAYIIGQLGVDGYEEIKRTALGQQQAEQKTESAKRKEAIALASRDPDWQMASMEQREQIIQDYMRFVN